jgi:hypothetical protein
MLNLERLSQRRCTKQRASSVSRQLSCFGGDGCRFTEESHLLWIGHLVIA